MNDTVDRAHSDNEDSCWGCGAAARARGLLCVVCADGLVSAGLCPEQLRARSLSFGGADDDAGEVALLVDGFGVAHGVRVHPASPAPFCAATLGRAAHCDVQIACGAVSSTHAALTFRPLSQVWFIEDQGGDNGTFVNGDRVRTRFPLEARDRIQLGRSVSFVFVPLDASERAAAARALLWQASAFSEQHTWGPSDDDDEGPLAIAVVKEGGAIARQGERRAQLTELELELLLTLKRAHDDDNEADASARGFVAADGLLGVLSFRSEAPTPANLRGLVRQLRNKLAERAVAHDVIESRRGLGYRLARPLVVR